MSDAKSSNSTDSTSTSSTSTLGEHALHLRADRTRDELRDTLDEIGRRVTPPTLIANLVARAKKEPGMFSAIGAGVVASIVGLVWFAVARSGQSAPKGW